MPMNDVDILIIGVVGLSYRHNVIVIECGPISIYIIAYLDMIYSLEN